MQRHHSMNYIEFPAKDLTATKAFFTHIFGWGFTDYGPEYAAITAAGLDGGFFKSDLRSLTKNGAALTVIYSDTIEETEKAVIKAGGKILKEIFSFPGGRRFHFTEPSGNEFAVWTEKI